MCVTVPYFIEIGQTVTEIWRLMFFKNGVLLPCNCWVRILTTNDVHLVVFSVVQNLLGIDAVVLIICIFQYFAR